MNNVADVITILGLNRNNQGRFVKGVVPWNKGCKTKVRKIDCRNGKTLEEYYGPEKANSIKRRISISRKGKSFEDMFGKEKAQKLKNKLSRPFEERYGTEKTQQLKDNLRKMNLGKKLSDETKQKISKNNARYWLGAKFSEERINKMSKRKKRYIPTKETREKLSIALKGRKVKDEIKRRVSATLMGHPVSGETRIKISISNKGKHSGSNNQFYGKHHTDETKTLLSKLGQGRRHKPSITRTVIIDTFAKLISKYGTKIGRYKLTNLVIKELNTSTYMIINRCGSIESILTELNVKVPNPMLWKKKQDLIEEVIRTYEGNIRTQQVHKGIGIPDIETEYTIYEAKSYFYMGWKDQLDRYTQLNKEVKFVVFEDKGKTDIPLERVILLKELVKGLPDNKKVLIQEKIERITQGIPLEQKSLIDCEAPE